VNPTTFVKLEQEVAETTILGVKEADIIRHCKKIITTVQQHFKVIASN